MAKFCEYLECIDLQEVCASFDETDLLEIESIPDPMTLKLEHYLEEWRYLARTSSEQPPQDDPLYMSDFLEETICDLIYTTDQKLALVPRNGNQGNTLEALALNYFFTDELEHYQAIAVAIYHYDLAIWFYQKQRPLELMACYEVISSADSKINLMEGHRREKYLKARAAAKARHAPTNKQKEKALKLWDETRQNYSSISGFSDTNCRKFDVKSRALASWISKHEKAKRAD